jgi:hypothetical protein
MKRIFGIITTLLLVTLMVQTNSCCKKKKAGVVEFPFGDTVIIPVTSLPGLGLKFYTDSIFSSVLQNTVTASLSEKAIPQAWVQSIKCAEMSMQVQDPPGQLLNFTDSLVMNIANKNGSNRKAIGHASIPGNTVGASFTIPDVNLKEYLLQDSMMLVIGGNYPATGVNVTVPTTLRFYGKFVGVYQEL